MTAMSLRRQAALYGERAKRTADPVRRHQLLTLAARFAELASKAEEPVQRRGWRLVAGDRGGKIAIEYVLLAGTFIFAVAGILTAISAASGTAPGALLASLA